MNPKMDEGHADKFKDLRVGLSPMQSILLLC